MSDDQTAKEGRILRVLVNEIALQCCFANRAFKGAGELLDQGDPRGVFFFVQAFLGHAANVSKLLWPSTLRASAAEQAAIRARRETLRAALGVDPTSAIEWRGARDTLEHYDERLEEWAAQTTDWNIVDMSVAPAGFFEGIAPGDIHRTIDPQTAIFSFRGVDYDLRAMAGDLSALAGTANAWLAADASRRREAHRRATRPDPAG